MSQTNGPDPAGNPSPLSCDELQEIAPDLALDLLDGASRAAALAHVDRCANCRTELSRLTETASQALLAAHEIPPPAGFERRVLEELGLTPEPSPSPQPTTHAARSPRSRRARMVAVAIAAVVLVALISGAVLIFNGNSDPRTTVVAMRTAQGTVAGEVELQHANPPTLDVDLGTWAETWERYDEVVDGPLWLTIDTGKGQDTYLLTTEAPFADTPNAELTLRGTDADDITSVAIVDDAGRVWCTATFDQA